MEKKKYYAVKASMTFKKTVLVPVDSVEDIYEAIGKVDAEIETGSILLLDEEADFDIGPSPYADKSGLYVLTDEDASYYDVVE